MLRLFIAFSLALLLFCPAYAQTQEPIKIGGSLSLTGKYSEMANMQLRSFRLWEKEINEKNGILGRKVTIIIYDDKSDPKNARALYEHLITQDRVDLVFGPYSSEITEAILPVTEQYGYPVIGSAATAVRLWKKGYKYFFGLYSPASSYVSGFLQLLSQNNISNIAIVYEEDIFSKDVAAGTKHWAENLGFKVSIYSSLGKDSKAYLELTARAKKARAQAFIMCGHFDEAVSMRQALKKASWYPKAFYASVGPGLSAYWERLGDNAENSFSTSQWEPHGKIPGSEAFYRKYLSSYGIIPSYHAANAYAAGELIEKAVRKAGTFDRDRLRDILSSMNTFTIIGRYNVDKTGRQIKRFPLIIQWQKGKREIVWPDDLRTAKPVLK
jgi:branched-chain amino acid transport system substrate-binding protein